jgi:hypothetical protein
MSKSSSHKRAQGKATGRGGKTEVKIKGTNKRLDAITKSGKTATEVERSGSTIGLEKAVQRLKSKRSKQKVLQVPQKDIPKAVLAMKKKGVGGTVKNMSGTKRRSV